jgi:biotin carboxyl carrier protein
MEDGEMRSYRVQINGRTYAVSVDRTDESRVRVMVEGRTFESTIIGTGELSTMVIQSEGGALRARCRALQNDKVQVWLVGALFQASTQAVGAGGYAIARETPEQPRTSEEIRALMPGRITSILVKEGDAVDAGTPLLILEAMKMQNEIVSPMKGAVKAIKVHEAEAVKKDAVLIQLSQR